MEARHFPNLVPARQILCSQDNQFCLHERVPKIEIRSAIKDSYDVNSAVTVKLWPITVLCTIGLLIVFVMLGFYGCTTIEGITCSLTKFPTISDIIRQRYFDRVFIFTMVFHVIIVQFPNIRAYHLKFHQVISPSINNFLYWVGLVSCVCQPMVGIVDNQLNGTIHLVFAIGFYICICIYFFILLGQIHSHGMDLLNQQQKQRLVCLYYFRYFMVVFLVVALWSGLKYRDNVPTPFLEWSGTLILMNFFTFTALIDSDYVELVAPPKAID